MDKRICVSFIFNQVAGHRLLTVVFNQKFLVLFSTIANVRACCVKEVTLITDTIFRRKKCNEICCIIDRKGL